MDQKFFEQASGDAVRAAHLRKAHYAKLALQSVRSRRKAREARESAVILDEVADAAEKALSQAGDAA
jgi:5-bromo-4-chloroindolyl phosphate hydrolysis protein